MMNAIIKAYRKGKRVKVELRLQHGYRRWRRIKGQVIGEYKNYILLQTPHYKECVDKDVFKINEAKLLDIRITEGDVA